MCNILVNSDGNKIQHDACTAIITSNWKQMKEMTVCRSYDKTGIVAALILVALNCPSSLKLNC